MNQTKYVLSTILAGILWGCISIFIKGLSAAGITTIQILALKAIIVIAAQLVFMLLTNRNGLKIKIKDIWLFFGTGVISLVFFQLCYFKSILEIGASTSVILLYTSPIWVLLLSAVFFHEKITLLKIIALVMTFAGCVMITGFGGTTISAKGLIIGLCAGLGYGLYSIFARLILKKYSTSTLIFYTFVVNGLALLPFSGIPAVFSNFTLSAFLYLLGIAILCTALPYALYSYGLSRLETSKAAILVTIEPLIGSLIGICFFREPFTALKLAGIAIILAAIILMGWKKD